MFRVAFYYRVQDVYATVFVSGRAGVSTESSSETSRTQHAKMYVVFQIVFYSSININFLSFVTNHPQIFASEGIFHS